MIKMAMNINPYPHPVAESKPVEIEYQDELIASLDDETTSCILKTGGKRCAYDINVRYAAPTAEVTFPVYTTTNPSDISEYTLRTTLTSPAGVNASIDTTGIIGQDQFNGIELVSINNGILGDESGSWWGDHLYAPRDGINEVNFPVPNLNDEQLSGYNALAIAILPPDDNT